MKTLPLLRRSLAAALLLAGIGVQAQDYPANAVTLVVPFTAGGPTDKVARDLAEAMRKPLGQTIVVDNVGGAGGTRGASKVAKAAADGYTLLLHHIGMATGSVMYRNLNYKVPDDFEYLGLINEVPMTLITKPTMAAKSYAELVSWLAANKDKANLANAGPGSASHLCGLLFMQAIKTDLVTIPYQGTGPAMQALVGNQVDVMCDQTTNTTGQIAGGAVKAYAVTSSKRLGGALSNLPTLDELGLKGFSVGIWHGLYAPKGTPKPVLDKIRAALKVAMMDADFKKRQEALGAVLITDARATDPAEHRKFVEAEIARWTPAIRAAGAYAD